MRGAASDTWRELCGRGEVACGPAFRYRGRDGLPTRRCRGRDGPPARRKPRGRDGPPARGASLLPSRSRLAFERAGIPRSWQKTTLVCCSNGLIRPCAPPSVPALTVLPGRRDGQKSAFRMAPRAMADYRRFLPREADFDAEPPMKRIGVRRPSSRSACRRAGCRHHGGGLTGTVATVVRRRKADFGASCARRWWVFPVVSGFPARAARPEPHQAPQASAGG